MSLKVIYGKAKTGKSNYIYSQIKELLKSNKDNKIFIITPEQFSFTAEKKLLQEIEKDAVVDAEVLTFHRMAYRVMNEVGGKTKVNLSSSGKAMTIQSILEKEKNNLKFLGKTTENIDIIDTAITEFKKHKIEVEYLKQVIENTQDVYRKTKLNDMTLLYEKYEQKMKGNYVDENDVLTILYNQLDQTDLFDNSMIYIDEFLGFTKQEYDVITKLLKVAKKVSVTFCIDNLETAINPDVDLFYSGKETLRILKDIAKEQNVLLEKPVFLNNIYGIDSEELIHIEENIFGPQYKKYEKNTQDIELFLALNPYTEIEYVATYIVKLVKEHGFRYRDIGVITKNLDLYSHLARAIFAKYNIPVFIDEKRDLSSNLLIQYVLSVLATLKENFSYESMFQYIKSGFLELEEDEVFVLENYCMKWGIRGKKWYQSPWNYGDLTKTQESKIKRLNELRLKIITPLLKFKSKLNGTKTVKEITTCLYNHMIENEVPKKLQDKIEILEEQGNIDIANEYKISFDILMELMDEIVMVLGQEKTTFERYLQTLKIGFTKTGLRKNTSFSRSSHNRRYKQIKIT